MLFASLCDRTPSQHRGISKPLLTATGNDAVRITKSYTRLSNQCHHRRSGFTSLAFRHRNHHSLESPILFPCRVLVLLETSLDPSRLRNPYHQDTMISITLIFSTFTAYHLRSYYLYIDVQYVRYSCAATDICTNVSFGLPACSYVRSPARLQHRTHPSVSRNHTLAYPTGDRGGHPLATFTSFPNVISVISILACNSGTVRTRSDLCRRQSLYDISLTRPSRDMVRYGAGKCMLA
jgi:hypothetical protein